MATKHQSYGKFLTSNQYKILEMTLQAHVLSLFCFMYEENHRLESSYQNHLVLKVLVVSESNFSTLSSFRIDYVSLAVDDLHKSSIAKLNVSILKH